MIMFLERRKNNAHVSIIIFLTHILIFSVDTIVFHPDESIERAYGKMQK